jgi:hypothetical protein
MTSEAERPDFDRLDELNSRAAEEASAPTGDVADAEWFVFVGELAAAYPSIRDYVKELEDQGRKAKSMTVALVKAQDERIERLTRALTALVDAVGGDMDEILDAVDGARDALAAGKEAE